MRQTVLFTGVGLLYFLTAWVTRVLVPGRELVSPIWPATGVGIAGLVLLDFGIWPGLLLGTIAASLSGL